MGKLGGGIGGGGYGEGKEKQRRRWGGSCMGACVNEYFMILS